MANKAQSAPRLERPPQSLTLSEVSNSCGVSVASLRLLVADGLIESKRSAKGHSYVPENAAPTAQHCRDLITRHRDRLLRQAAALLERIRVECDAVGNDIAEAREHPEQPLGVDLLAATSYTSNGNFTALSAALHQLDRARMLIVRYHQALEDLVDDDRG